MSTTYGICKNEFKLRICDHILDNSYGHIGITKVERKIERAPIFKRLHNISQLGLVNWIFPCALHTRYTHSIGVMHIAGQIAECINSNKGFAFFNDNEIQIIRLAGLLHDIGHYPLSHNVEQVYKDISSNKPREIATESIKKHLGEYVNCPSFLNPSIEVFEEPKLVKSARFINGFEGSKGYHHEAIGQSIIEKNEDIFTAIKNNFILISDNDDTCATFLNPFFSEEGKNTYSEDDINKKTQKLLEMIGNIVIGNYYYNACHGWDEKYSAMIQIIHSDLDADNIDYLLRDATFSGTSYGIMDMSVLLNSITVNELKICIESPGVASKKYIVGVLPKGIGCVEQFLINKYLAYSQMTLSKYVSILEAMLSSVAKLLLREDKEYEPKKLMDMVNSTKTEENYLQFTDSFILRKIYETSASLPMCSELYKAILSSLKNYSAFNLSTSAGQTCSECICVSSSKDGIVNAMKSNEVYKRFESVCEKYGDKTGNDYDKNDVINKALFSFRFERYQLTKQIPLNVFREEYINDSSEELQANYHYYRLGQGVPVLEKEKEYSISFNNNHIDLNIPSLTVDCDSSSLRSLHDLQFVSLREYNIAEYQYNA